MATDTERILERLAALEERLLRDLWGHLELRPPGRRTSDELLTQATRALAARGTPMPRRVHDYMRAIPMPRNRAAHELQASPADAVESLRHLSEVANWYFAEHLGLADVTPTPPEPAAPRPRAPRRLALAARAALAGLLSAVVGHALLWPRFESLTVVEDVEGAPSLVLGGRNLDVFTATWGQPWVATLAAQGLLTSGAAPDVSADRPTARLPLVLDPEWDAASLPLPSLVLDRSHSTAPLRYRSRLRVAAILWNAEDAETPRRLRRVYTDGFARLLTDIAAGRVAWTWPPMADVRGLDSCATANFEVLERRILTDPDLASCVPELAEARDRRSAGAR